KSGHTQSCKDSVGPKASTPQCHEHGHAAHHQPQTTAHQAGQYFGHGNQSPYANAVESPTNPQPSYSADHAGHACHAAHNQPHVPERWSSGPLAGQTAATKQPVCQKLQKTKTCVTPTTFRHQLSRQKTRAHYPYSPADTNLRTPRRKQSL